MATIGDIMKRIIEKAGLTQEQLNEVPSVQRAVDEAGNMWALGEKAPIGAGLLVVLMVKEDEAGRVLVYAMPGEAGAHHMRFSIKTRAIVEAMTNTVFEDMMAATLSGLFQGGEEDNDDDDDDDEAPEIGAMMRWLEENPTATAAQAREAFTDEKHMVYLEEGETPEASANGAPPAAPPAPPAAVLPPPPSPLPTS